VPRAVAPLSKPPAPRRARKPPRDELQRSAPVETVDPLREQVAALLAEGVDELGALTASTTGGLEADERFRVAGRVADWAARLGEPRRARHRPWVVVDDGLALEQWRLERLADER
jgi:hypothetical protein